MPDLDGRGTPAPYPGTGAAVARLNEAGLVVVVVTNQPVVGRGEVTEAQVEEALAELTRTVAEDGGRIDASFYCPHHPRADLPEYRRSCECRKPAPGMLLEAAEALGLDLAASAMVGDRPSDMEAGWRAG